MRSRRGFTLIEIMVVVALIAFLATILIVALRGSISGARVQATKSTITKISGLLRQRIDAWNRVDFEAQFELDIDVNEKQLGVSHDMAVVLTKKQIFGKYFPQTWADASMIITQINAAQTNPITGTGTPFAPPTTITPACESAEVLYWMLTDERVRMFGYTPEGTDNFTGATADTDGNGFLEIVDAWGNPLRFYRWPTRLFRPNGRLSTPTIFVYVQTADLDVARVLVPDAPYSAFTAGGSHPNLSTDPDDPLGLIENAYENQVGPYFQPATFEDNYHTIGTYFTPLVMSCGPDGKPGLGEPSDRGLGRGYWGSANGTSDHFDNITNHNTKSGGQ